MNKDLHVLSANQFDQKTLLEILNQAQEMEKVIQKGGTNIADKKILAALFYEPSTRTRLSFETAMLRLGGNIISENDVNFSSQTKGEILEDTIKMVSGYADIIALRSKNSGDAKLAATASSVPILNGGDGSGEHPTQGLLDLYTIYKKFPERFGKETIKIAFVGDLKYGRTVHSACQLLRNFEGFELQFVAPEELQIPEKYRQKNETQKDQLDAETLQNADVIYDTRLQKERFEDASIYEKFREKFVFDVQKVQQMKPKSILMHPLPRINEITTEVDALPQAAYFQQAQNGVPVRMALIARSLNLL